MSEEIRAVGELERRKAQLENLYTTELARIAQKRQLLYSIETRMRMIRPSLLEAEKIAISFTAPFGRVEERIRQLQRYRQEYNRLSSMRERLLRDIVLEEEKLMKIRSEISKIEMQITKIVEAQMKRLEVAKVLPEEQVGRIEEKISELTSKMLKALREGRVEEAEKIKEQIDRLRRRLGRGAVGA